MKRGGIYCVLLVLLSGPVSATEAQAPSAAVQPLLAEIRMRQSDIDRRERALAERERTQLELETLVETQLQEIMEQRETMEKRITAWEASSGERIRQLAKIYAAMKPAKAAQLLEGLDANLATQILSKMKHKKSAAILERIESERALTVSRQVAHPLSFEPADLPAGDS